MRILVLGNNYSAKRFCDLFEKNKDNIVFSTIADKNTYMDFQNERDILEFCVENIINLVLITEEKYILCNLQDLISQENITVFSPSSEALEICYSKAYAKKFMYKNKIPTAKFQIMEKSFQALDYIKQTKFPLVLRPDNHNPKETAVFVETYIQAKKAIQEIFSNDNKKVLIEDYIEGKNFNIWVLSDGYKAKIIGTSAKYQNDIAYFDPDFVTEELKENLFDTVIMRTINSLAQTQNEYIGILGFDFILDRYNNAFLVGYNSFFDDINTDFFINDNYNWAEIFESTIVGDVFLKYEFNKSDDFMLSLRQGDKINFVKAKTKSNLYRYLEELDFDLEEYKEAEKIWKF